MNSYRLLAGLHVEADPNWKPKPTDPPGTKAPDKVYSTGQIVDSNSDLVEVYGAGKFQLVGQKMTSEGVYLQGSQLPGDPTPQSAQYSPSVFPSGQVSGGLQVAAGDTGSVQGVPSGPLTGQTLEKVPTVQKGQAVNKPMEQAPTAEEQAKPQQTQPQTPQSQPPTIQLPKNIDSMNVNELKAFAAEEEIDIKGSSNRSEIVKAIKAAAGVK